MLYSRFSETQLANLTFYGVKKEVLNIPRGANTVYEKDLPIYNERLQMNKYNEGTCLYHVYTNRLYSQYEYVGFCQYDMSLDQPEIFRRAEIALRENSNVIFHEGIFPLNCSFRGGQSAILVDYPFMKAGLASYNRTFKTNYNKETLLANRMIKCNSFLVPKPMYEKLMAWLLQYFHNDAHRSMLDEADNLEFNPGHVIEALVGMFFALEIEESGARYEIMHISHKHNLTVPKT
jgi:hypothetical protein